MPEALQAPEVATFLAVDAARQGHKQEAQKVLDEMERHRPGEYVEPFLGIELASALGDRVRLRQWARRAYEERSTYLVYLSLHKYLYLDDPETEAIIAKAHRGS